MLASTSGIGSTATAEIAALCVVLPDVMVRVPLYVPLVSGINKISTLPTPLLTLWLRI